MADDSFWKSEKYEYLGNNVIRAGRHTKENANLTDPGWYIWTYTYDSNGFITDRSGPAIGPWTA